MTMNLVGDLDLDLVSMNVASKFRIMNLKFMSLAFMCVQLQGYDITELLQAT